MPTPAPNLLFLWTDEQRPDTMACYGNRTIHTPHLDKLAAQSFVFDHCYCVQPVCTPSRGSIMTGLWPHQHACVGNNVPLDAQTRTIAEMVDDRYRTGYFGKWHLGDDIFAQHGFDEWVAIEDDYRNHYSDPTTRDQRSAYHHFLIEQGFPPDCTSSDGPLFSRSFAAALPEPYTKAAFLGHEAARFIGEQSPDRPWLLSVNFLEPHMPFFGPRNCEYTPEELEVSPVFGCPPDGDMSLRNRYFADLYQQFGHGNWPLHDDWHRRRLRANYDGLVTMIDAAIGRILDALDASGQADNTIVVFTSDHGDMMGDHCQFAKTVMYEPSIGVPLLMRVPWLACSQVRIEGRFSHIDLLPTLLELMGQTTPSPCAGVSRAPVLRGERTLKDNDVIVHWNAPPQPPARPKPEGYSGDQLDIIGNQNWRTLITADGWKLNLCATDRNELHDLNEDPYEQRNRIDDPACRARRDRMIEQVLAWQKAHGDTVAVM